jgi:hypothetical protein
VRVWRTTTPQEPLHNEVQGLRPEHAVCRPGAGVLPVPDGGPALPPLAGGSCARTGPVCRHCRDGDRPHLRSGKASRRCVEAPHASRHVLTVRCTVRPYHATYGVIPHGGQPLGLPGAPPRPSCPHRDKYVTPALALSLPPVCLDVIALVASSCGYTRGGNRATRCAGMHDARGDTEKARGTSTTPPSAVRAARGTPVGVSRWASTAGPEAWHRSGSLGLPMGVPTVEARQRCTTCAVACTAPTNVGIFSCKLVC